MHNKINILSKLVASQIAAGEVVDRPASVLKELLENSIDAKSTNILINIRKGGAKLIKIQDDGTGISKEDLQLALTQHATSKIKDIADLNKIYSLGFRGEALASIASVSKIKIKSKTADQEHGYEISAENNNFTTLQICAHPYGTTIEMQDLYFNTPARRRFLRSDKTEMIHIEEVFKRIVLSNFSINFRLYVDNKEVYNFPSCSTEKHRLNRITKIFGNNFSKNSKYIKVSQNRMELSGWVVGHESLSPYSNYQYFFINGRLVKDRMISNTIRNAYRDSNNNFLDKHPMYCLYLNLDPDAIDINVHPTKLEVRFRESRVIFLFLLQAISEFLKVNTRSIDYNINCLSKIENQFNTELKINNKVLKIINFQDKIIFIDLAEARKCLNDYKSEEEILTKKILDKKLDLLKQQYVRIFCETQLKELIFAETW